jgi:hypothetical protein
MPPTANQIRNGKTILVAAQGRTKMNDTTKKFVTIVGAILTSFFLLLFAWWGYLKYDEWSEQQRQEQAQHQTDNFQNCLRLISNLEMQGLRSAEYPQNDPRGVQDEQLVAKVEKVKNDDADWVHKNFPDGTMSDKGYAACKAREDSEHLH